MLPAPPALRTPGRADVTDTAAEHSVDRYRRDAGRDQADRVTSASRPVWTGSLLSGPVHGPLPALLLTMTATTGIVDAVSVLKLGKVFVANMTGNVVFLGFAVAGAPGFALAASLAALGGFLAGALLGGVLATRRHPWRARLLRDAVLVELVLLAAATVLLWIMPDPGTAAASLVAALAAIALGMQNAAVGKLGVPDLTTTVLTRTLAGIAADVRSSGWRVVLRRGLAVLLMFAGALVGALLVRYAGPAPALLSALVLLALVILVLALALRTPAPWHRTL
jgi:uncharacterized membrane protein YoaK (UPF0700 family)